MLYRTLHNPFLCTSNLPSSQGMEPMKNEFLPEGEDGMAGGTGDDLCIDEFLDFSNGASELEEQVPTPSPEEKKKALVALPEKEVPMGFEAGGFDGRDDFGSFHGSELSAEAEGLESLEWLSHFVEDSLPDYSLAGKLVAPPTKTEKTSEPAADFSVPEQRCFATPLQTKARTKRGRTGVRVWPVLHHSPVESSSSSISSSSSTTSFSAPSLWFGPGDPKLAKKFKKKPTSDGIVAVAQPRKCSHCGVTKTPQWRAGPLGSKTLCNACGVRFKSGRLLPEYRPACSPTFSSEMHSNNHRKVLEMRRKKEVETGDTTTPPPPHPVVPLPVRSF